MLDMHFAVKQHDDFHSATGKRRHLNCIMKDVIDYNCQLNGDYKTAAMREAMHSIRSTYIVHPKPTRKPQDDVTKASSAVVTSPSPRIGPVYLDKDGEAAEVLGKVLDTSVGRVVDFGIGNALGSMNLEIQGGRKDSGGLFSLSNPALVKGKPANSFPTAQNPTQLALEQQGRDVNRPPDRHLRGGARPSIREAVSVGGQPIWLMPWQTGDRDAGAKVARMVCSKRTPIGAFANQDLAVKR